MPKRDYQSLVNGMTDVQKKVWLGSMFDAYDVERIAADLFRARRNSYNLELTEQAARVGCPGRAGQLGNGAILSGLKDMSVQDAIGIANTFNYDLAVAIVNVSVETPKANRWTYAAKLRTWEPARGEWKNPQILQYAEGTARAQAQSDFMRYNQNVFGVAVLEPKQAVCPICIGWIARGQIPLNVAMANPPPYHPGCPHQFIVNPEQVSRDSCPQLWVGQ